MTYPSFSVGEVLTAADMNQVGLWLVKTQALSGSSTTVTGAFSSSFDSYRLVFSNLVSSTSTTRDVRLRMGTTATNTYNWGETFLYGAPITAGNGGFANQDSASIGPTSNVPHMSLVLDIHLPNVSTRPTTWTWQGMTYQTNIGAWVYRNGFGIEGTNAAYTSFTVFPVADTMTGTVRVYGYRN